jgi:hypothetical protein
MKRQRKSKLFAPKTEIVKMDSEIRIKSSKPRHLQFEARFIGFSLGVALLAGFGIGAHIAFIIGYGMPLHTGFQTYIQLHGHVQLIGWVGLFVIGISLHFLPRLASVPISRPLWPRLILACLASGVILRTVNHSILPYVSGSAFFAIFNWLGVISGVLEWMGIYIYLMLILRTILLASTQNTENFHAIRPFFAMQLAGWAISAIINLGLLVRMAITNNVILDPAWNQFKVDIFVGLVLLPVAFAFSVKTLPLYLRLRATDWPVRSVAIIYFLAFCVQILPHSPIFIKSFSSGLALISTIGTFVKAFAIIFFVWKLDVLTRTKQPWTVDRELQPGPERRPTRKDLPDYGEFGRFERLIYSAYSWLVLGALFEIFYAFAEILNIPLLHIFDLVRHIYLLGFITLLILGMSVRMIPGFVKKKRIASTRLVDATFWLGNIAAAFRILPLVVTFPVLSRYALLVKIAEIAFAWSGVIAIFALACLAVNLRKTLKH